MAAFNYNISVTGDCSNSNLGSVYLTLNGGVPPYTVQWTDPNLGADVVINDEISFRLNLSAGTYAVRAIDSTLPTNQEFYINIPVSSGVCCSILGVQNATCGLNNGIVTGTSTSSYSSTNFYLYHFDGTLSQSATTNQSVINFGNLTAGTYYLTALDLGGCLGRSQSFIVEGGGEMDFGIYSVPNSSCGGTPIGKLTVTGQTGSPPYSYLWGNGDTGSTVTGLTTGIYSVQVTDNLGCVKNKTANVYDVQPIGFGVFTVTQPSCFASDGIINLTITGGTAPYYYSASTGNVAISYNRTYSLSGLSSGQYSFLVTDAAFCTVAASTSLETPKGVVSVNVNTQNSSCSSANGSITISVVGGTFPYIYTIIYPDGSTTSVSNNQTTQVFSNLSSGTYTVSVQDAIGCSYLQETTLITENKFTISTQVTGTTCSQNNGTILVTRSAGGTEPFDYSLDNDNSIIDTNLSTITFTNVSSGQHTVTVTDAVGCIQTSQVYVNSSSSLDFILYTTSCGNGSDGTMTAIISSGTPPFSFNWSNNVIGNPQEIEVTNLTAGTYSLTVIDSVGCSLNRTASINCASSYVSYQTYVMGSEIFQIESQGKNGLLQMLNDGFVDLTLENNGCNLNSASFNAKISVEPIGLTTNQTFYTSTSLIDAPADNLWYDTIKTLLQSILGIGRVIIDPINNKITIETDRGNNSLNGQEIIIELVIIYDINCLG
jgi:uncharacterized protein (DUF2141 family)